MPGLLQAYAVQELVQQSVPIRLLLEYCIVHYAGCSYYTRGDVKIVSQLGD